MFLFFMVFTVFTPIIMPIMFVSRRHIYIGLIYKYLPTFIIVITSVFYFVINKREPVSKRTSLFDWDCNCIQYFLIITIVYFL